MSDSPSSGLATRLGRRGDAKLLLINADDAGMCQAVNAGVERAMLHGAVTSTTAMVPCAWFDDFAARALRNPALKVGIHLTATSEWRHYRWGPVSPRGRVPSLLDEQGFFHATHEVYARQADPAEVEIEFRAQIERFLASGLRPTHIDSHMGVYHFDDRIFRIARTLAQEYRLCMRVAVPERVAALQAEGWAVADHIFFQTHDVPLEQRRQMYLEVFDHLPAGVTELVIHPAEPTEELRAIGGMWQRRGFDLEFFTNPETEDLLADRGIELVGYDRLQALTAEALGWGRA